jgi:hypothetical protein
MSHQRYKLVVIVGEYIGQELNTSLNVLLKRLSSIRLPQFILRCKAIFNQKSRICRTDPRPTTSLVARMHAESFAELFLDDRFHYPLRQGELSRV